MQVINVVFINGAHGAVAVAAFKDYPDAKAYVDQRVADAESANRGGLYDYRIQLMPVFETIEEHNNY